MRLVAYVHSSIEISTKIFTSINQKLSISNIRPHKHTSKCFVIHHICTTLYIHINAWRGKIDWILIIQKLPLDHRNFVWPPPPPSPYTYLHHKSPGQLFSISFIYGRNIKIKMYAYHLRYYTLKISILYIFLMDNSFIHIRGQLVENGFCYSRIFILILLLISKHIVQFNIRDPL